MVLADTEPFTHQNFLIPPGCIRELIVQPNGDEITRSINLGDTFFKGCLSSSKYQTSLKAKGNRIIPENSKGLKSYYDHLKDYGKGVHLIEYTEEVTGKNEPLNELILIKIESLNLIELTEKGTTRKDKVDVLTKIASIRLTDKSLKDDLIKNINIDKILSLTLSN
jgi:hypothetical protein